MTHTNIVKFLSSLDNGKGLSLDNAKLLFDRLGNPQKSISVIKVFGESGKSSVISMLSGALSAAGYTVGTLTTPYIHTVEGAFSICGEQPSIELFTKYAQIVIGEILLLNKSSGNSFEISMDDVMLTIAACMFYREGCSVGIIELSGGSLVHQLFTTTPVSLITSVSKTETAWEICSMIDRNSGEIITAIQSRDVYKIIFDKCAEINIRLTMPLKNAFLFMRVSTKRLDFTYESKVYTLKTGAYYQVYNFLCATKAIEALRRFGFKIENSQICSAEINRGLPLRFEVVSILPTIIIDRADTEERRRSLIESIGKLDGSISNTPTVICETDRHKICDEFLALSTSTDVIEIPLKNSRRQLITLFDRITDNDTLIVVGSSQYCEKISKVIKEILM